MENKKAVFRYAKTLFIFARKHNTLDDVVRDMENISLLFKQTEKLSSFLSNPLQSENVFENIINTDFSKLITQHTLSFIRLLKEKKRLDILVFIPEAFLRVYEDHMNILRVIVRSAMPLTGSQLEKIQGVLQRQYPDKNLVLTNLEKSDLIAGFQIQIKDTIFESNIKSSLFQLKRSLAA